MLNFLKNHALRPKYLLTGGFFIVKTAVNLLENRAYSYELAAVTTLAVNTAAFASLCYALDTIEHKGVPRIEPDKDPVTWEPLTNPVFSHGHMHPMNKSSFDRIIKEQGDQNGEAACPLCREPISSKTMRYTKLK